MARDQCEVDGLKWAAARQVRDAAEAKVMAAQQGLAACRASFGPSLAMEPAACQVEKDILDAANAELLAANAADTNAGAAYHACQATTGVATADPLPADAVATAPLPGEMP